MMDAESYLRHFGYMSAMVPLTEAIRAFRRAWGLPDGDEVDGTLERAMQSPRCGLPDYRLATEESKWRKRPLSYFVTSYVNGLSRQDQDELIGMAWADWMAVANLEIRRANSPTSADILIATGRGRAQGFDGPQGTLAWAQLPSGDDRQLTMRFDLDETWVRSTADRGIIFRNVACHEFGHLLGLDHSTQRGALMAPYYAPGIVSPQAVDDVPRIQGLYGAAPAPIPPTTTRIIMEFQGPIPGFTVRREP